MAEFPGEIFLDNDFNVRAGSADAPLTVEHPTTGAVGAFTAQTIRVYIASTDGSDGTVPVLVHADLSIELTEAGAVPGFYRGGFSGAHLRTHLATAIDQKRYLVYESLTGPGGTRNGVYQRVEEVMVRMRTGS